MTESTYRRAFAPAFVFCAFLALGGCTALEPTGAGDGLPGVAGTYTVTGAGSGGLFLTGEMSLRETALSGLSATTVSGSGDLLLSSGGSGEVRLTGCVQTVAVNVTGTTTLRMAVGMGTVEFQAQLVPGVGQWRANTTNIAIIGTPPIVLSGVTGIRTRVPPVISRGC